MEERKKARNWGGNRANKKIRATGNATTSLQVEEKSATRKAKRKEKRKETCHYSDLSGSMDPSEHVPVGEFTARIT
jgi:hypothetical protein